MASTRRVFGFKKLGGWWLLIGLCAAQLMVALDATVVNVALPSIGRSLKLTPSDLQGVITAYLLCSGGFMILGGRAADLVGRRAILNLGLVIFTTASAASGLAGSAAVLIAARAGQGVGAALLSPAALSTIMSAYTAERRAVALSAWGAVGAGGFVVGMLMGGVLTSWLSWHWVFFINVPVGIVVLVAVGPRFDAHHHLTQASPGFVAWSPLLLTAGLASLVYGISSGPTAGWASARILATLVAGGALLVAFGGLEFASPGSFVPSALWRDRSLQVGVGLMAGITAALAGTLILTTFLLQAQLHTSPLHTGLDYLPFAIAIGIAAHLAPKLILHAGAKTASVIAFVVVACGEALLAVAPGNASYATALAPAFVVLGVGTGLGFVAASVTAVSSVTDEATGGASGLLTTSHELGAAIGVAVMSAIATTAGHGSDVTRLASGHRVGFIFAAGLAAALAMLAALAVPAFRPARHAHIRIH